MPNFDDLNEKFAFHMSDMARNLMALAKAYESPNSCDTKCLSESTALFFNDEVPHLMGAALICGEIPQVFEEQNGVHDWHSFNVIAWTHVHMFICSRNSRKDYAR